MKKILVGLVIVFFLCAVVAVIGSLGSKPGPKIEQAAVSSTPSPQAQPTAAAKVVAASTTEAPKPTVAPMQPSYGTVGQKVTSAGVALSLAGVKRTSDSGNQFIKPKQGNEYVLAEVLIENVDRDTTPYNPLYFSVKDSDGFEYNASLMVGDNGLKSGELAKGEKVRGIVSFEVPAKANGLVMTYKPLVILGGYDPIKFKLD